MKNTHVQPDVWGSELVLTNDDKKVTVIVMGKGDNNLSVEIPLTDKKNIDKLKEFINSL